MKIEKALRSKKLNAKEQSLEHTLGLEERRCGLADGLAWEILHTSGQQEIAKRRKTTAKQNQIRKKLKTKIKLN
jgi:hypothetical protein